MRLRNNFCRVLDEREVISILAKQKWQEAGKPEGQDLRFWTEAERDVRERELSVMQTDFGPLVTVH